MTEIQFQRSGEKWGSSIKYNGSVAMERRLILSSAIASGAVLSLTGFRSFPNEAVAMDLSHFKIDGALVLRAYRSLVEEHLAGVLRSIRALAVTSDAQQGNWESVRPALAHLSGDLATAAAVWLAQPNGSYATIEKGPIDQNLSDRAYFPKLMSGHDTVGSLVVSKSTGLRSIIVATPLTNQGKIIGAIGTSLDARRISQMVIDRVGLPDSLTFYALDSHGQTAIHKDPAKMFQFPSDLGDKSLASAVQIILLQPSGMAYYRLEGVDRKAMFDTSDLTGWHFVLVQLAK